MAGNARQFVVLVVLSVGLVSCQKTHALQATPSVPRPESATCALGEEEAAGLNDDLSIHMGALHEYESTISGLLKQEKFETLDCLADHARAHKERFPGGMWKIHELYRGITVPVIAPQHATTEDWETLLQRLQRWKTANPNSITARVALAGAYVGYAYDARGTGDGNTVSNSGWKLLHERIAQAKVILDDASSLPVKCPEWYLVMQDVALDEDGSTDRLRSLFEEAYKFEPGYYYYARALAIYLLPKWQGRPGDTERFVEEISDRVGGDSGDILYFQISSSSAVLCGCEDAPKLSLERIERGFAAAEKQYGVSMLNLNRVAYLATHYGKRDPILADKVLARIGDQWDSDSWESEEYFQMVKQWAAHTAPFAVKLHEMEAAADANMKTPDGPVYKASFEKAYRGLVQECVRTDGGSIDQWQGQFEVLTSIGAKGTVEDSNIYSAGPVVTCMFEKMRALQKEKTIQFPPPPKDGYWVRIDLDWADFAPVAAK
jgi:hypothetical protein